MQIFHASSHKVLPKNRKHKSPFKIQLNFHRSALRLFPFIRHFFYFVSHPRYMSILKTFFYDIDSGGERYNKNLSAEIKIPSRKSNLRAKLQNYIIFSATLFAKSFGAQSTLKGRIELAFQKFVIDIFME